MIFLLRYTKAQRDQVSASDTKITKPTWRQWPVGQNRTEAGIAQTIIPETREDFL